MICAIVLAAGCSNRMGVQKLLLPFGRKTVISHIVDQLLFSKVNKIYVVVGHHAEQVTNELSDKQISIIPNPEYKFGMLSSVRAGLREIPEKYKGVLVVLGDQPSITTNLADKMIKSFFMKENKIIVPLYNGKRGHPILFSMSYKNEILTKYDKVGLRGILKEHPGDVYGMNVSDPSVLLDMDYPDDYKREIEKYEKRSVILRVLCRLLYK